MPVLTSPFQLQHYSSGPSKCVSEYLSNPFIFIGFGGQVDFIRGAGEGYDGLGKPIIAMASTSPRGVSKIVPYIKEGMFLSKTFTYVKLTYLKFL